MTAGATLPPETRRVLRSALATIADLRAAGVPLDAFTIADDLRAWTLAARALPILRDFDERLRSLDDPRVNLVFSEPLRAAVASEIASCEEILGPGWKLPRYGDLRRDARFGDFVVRIYTAIAPHMPTSPRQRAPERRGRPVEFSRPAARLTARLVNFCCARAVGGRVAEQDVLARVQRYVARQQRNLSTAD